MSSESAAIAPVAKVGFLKNVAWNWAGMGANIVIAIFLAPFMIHRLGDERYGMWALAIPIIEYCWILDFGFRSATIKSVAEFQAVREWRQLNAVINTAVVYYAVVGGCVTIAAIFAAPVLAPLFKVAPNEVQDFRWLITILGAGWGIGVTFSIFQASLEGFQRFDITTRVFIMMNVLRFILCVAVLLAGYGVVALAIAVVGSQMAGYALYGFFTYRVFPELRFHPSLVSWKLLKALASYGVHTLVASLSLQSITQSTPLLIGYFRPIAFVGYYNIAMRLLNTTINELVSRVAVVSTPRSAELIARGERESIAAMTTTANRYCFMIFMPVALVVGFFGRSILTLWIRRAAVAAHTSPLLIPMVIASGVMASQFNSSAVLYGMAKHAKYARGVAVEAVLSVFLMFLIVPHYGAVGAVWVAAALMAADRGVYTSLLLCRALEISWWRFVYSIYAMPIAAALPSALFLLMVRMYAGGDNAGFVMLTLSAGTALLLYAVLCLLLCVPPEHRAMLFRFARFSPSGIR